MKPIVKAVLFQVDQLMEADLDEQIPLNYEELLIILRREPVRGLLWVLLGQTEPRGEPV